VSVLRGDRPKRKKKQRIVLLAIIRSRCSAIWIKPPRVARTEVRKGVTLRHLTYDSRNGLFTLDFIQITIVARHVQYMTGASISFV